MKGVNFIHMSDIENGKYKETQVKDDRACAKGKRVTCRPYGRKGIKDRIMAAYLVFTGKADVLYFEGNQ